MDFSKIFLNKFESTIDLNYATQESKVNSGGIKSKEIIIDDSIKNEIQTALNQTDEESTIMAEDYYAANKDVQRPKVIYDNSYESLVDAMGPNRTEELSKAHGIDVTSSANFEQDVLNSQGVTYVVLTNLGNCGSCNSLENLLGKFKSDIDGVANLYNMNWQANAELCRDLCYNQGGIAAPAGLPKIAKFVDGQFVGIVGDEVMGASYTRVTTEDGTKKPAFARGEQGYQYVEKPDLIINLLKDATTPVEDPSITRARNGLAITNADKFYENVECSTGTTYVVMNDDYHMGGADFGDGGHLTAALLDAKDDLEKVANVYTLVWDDNKDAELCRKITYEMGKLPKPAPVPQVAKFVDGKFVGLLSSNVMDKGCQHANVKTNPVIEEMLAKAEGTPGTIYTNKMNGMKETSENKENAETTKSDSFEKEQLKQKLDKLKVQIAQKEVEAKMYENFIEEKQQEIEEIKEEMADSEAENMHSFYNTSRIGSLNSEINLYDSMTNRNKIELFSLKKQYFSASMDYLKTIK